MNCLMVCITLKFSTLFRISQSSGSECSVASSQKSSSSRSIQCEVGYKIDSRLHEVYSMFLSPFLFRGFRLVDQYHLIIQDFEVLMNILKYYTWALVILHIKIFIALSDKHVLEGLLIVFEQSVKLTVRGLYLGEK